MRQNMLVTIRTLVLLEDRVICDYERKCGSRDRFKKQSAEDLKNQEYGLDYAKGGAAESS